jgi:protein-tyrosine-phosphatase
MNLHFVCTGNVFRSRLAQAYAKSLLKNRTDINVTSSGVQADVGQDGPIAWYALKILDDSDLIPFISPIWVQTTSEILSSQDLIIFMQSWHLQQCQQRFGYTGTNYQVWDIADVTPDLNDDQIITFSQKKFAAIKIKVANLINQLFP